MCPDLYATLRRFVDRWTDARTRSVADDIVQESAIAALQAPLADASKLNSVARTIARRVRYKMLHGNAIDRRTTLVDMDTLTEPATLDERLQLLRDRLAKLPRHEVAMLMDYYSGRSIGAIAREHGLSPGACRVRMFRVRVAIRRTIHD